MDQAPSIRILEKDSNRRGDLFGRLMADLFVALGYQHPRLNIHKSGRELDLEAEHRLEPRRAVAECKATADLTGGDEVNKFVGTLDAERKARIPIVGYFVSLSGFKETAIEQEKQGRRTKIILMDGRKVVDELIVGGRIKSRNVALEIAGRCCATLGQANLDLEPQAELLAHERGWIWAIYYAHGKLRSHFALIHSDGTPLARALADEITAADRECGGNLYNFVCLNPPPRQGGETQAQVAAALSAYRQYLESECGYIQLDGLPADAEVGARRLRLESLFVPLSLDVTLNVGGEEKILYRQQAGAILNEHLRLAVLAAPGGGKSTLLKRLAVAYANPARRDHSTDNLPSRDWFPLFFRCRELRDLARGSFAELLDSLGQREPVRQQAEVFRAEVDRALLEGQVLLLVDGLDEISDPGDRAAFVCTLRSALQAYPRTAVVITSREAGFRHVAAHLAPVCTKATVSHFDSEDIRRLCVAWHCEVIGDTEKVRADAEQLAATITQSDRISQLAVNPLLLTTLLLVKRWLGALPTRRAVLYAKAVEVLLMTWNTEGHDPIPEEEALPQLCYVAAAMMSEGVQKISRPRLATLLKEARAALPTELGYVGDTVEQFIHRVEDRSSLLMMTGHDVETGQLVEFFEFRHLTFQEFLTARAMVEGWHPERREEDSLAMVLEPHFEEAAWQEVIPLAAVLGGKATEALLQQLTKTVMRFERIDQRYPSFAALVNCLADEAAARRETIRAAIQQVVRLGSGLVNVFDRNEAPIRVLVRGRYGGDFRAEAGKAFLSGSPDFANPGDALLVAVWWQTLSSEDPAQFSPALEHFVALLTQHDELKRCEGATGFGRMCTTLADPAFRNQLVVYEPFIKQGGPRLLPMLAGTPAECVSALYALSHLSELRIWMPPADFDLLGSFARLWLEGSDPTIRSLAARAFIYQPLQSHQDGLEAVSDQRVRAEELLRDYSKLDFWPEKHAALVLSWYLDLLKEPEIVRQARDLKNPVRGSALMDLVKILEKRGTSSSYNSES